MVVLRQRAAVQKCEACMPSLNALQLLHIAPMPCACQGVAFADELLSLVHAVRKGELRAGRTCGIVQVVDLGEQSSWAD